MRLLDGSHCYVIVGDKNHFEIIRGPLALGQACDKIGQLRVRHPEQSYKIMEPIFCEHGCCILMDRVIYVLRKHPDSLHPDFKKCQRSRPGKILR